MEDYICFEANNVINNIDKATTIYFINKKFKKNPFLLGKKLYIPKEILIKHDSEILNELYTREPSGLINLEGVCYMNAVLQCLYYCSPITKYFIMLDEYNKNQLGLVSKGYYDFIHGLFNGNKNAAKNLRSAIIKTDDSFAGKGGKDSKDLIIFLLSELHEELSENDTPLQKLENRIIDKSNKLAVYQEKIDLDKINNNNTIISDTFDYMVLLEYKCNNNKCKGLYSKTFFHIQNENIIIFELKNIVKKQFNNNIPIISLDECCSNINKTDIIVCPFCKTKELKITKSICSLPDIFIFVMSRGKYAEFDCKISFPKEIDMEKYYIPINNTYKEKDTKYDLIGATFVYDWYKGYGHEGHTIAFCKTYNKGNYYIFNDRIVKESNINKIYDKVPYILIYERRKKK
jgi:ubiquitin C-terminal hydrolase